MLSEFPAAIERDAVIVLGQRTRRRHQRHVIFPRTGFGARVRQAPGSPWPARSIHASNCFPVLGRNGDDRPAQHVDLRRLQSLPAHEIAQRRPRLLRGRFQNGPFVGIDPDAEYRCCGRILHVYDNSIHTRENQPRFVPSSRPERRVHIGGGVRAHDEHRLHQPNAFTFIAKPGYPGARRFHCRFFLPVFSPLLVPKFCKNFHC